MDPILPARLKAAAPGLGHASQVDIERRAMEIAGADGRDAFTDVDLSAAAVELAGGSVSSSAPEADSSIKPVVTWDEPPAETGRRVAPVPLEDEAAVAEQLVQQGMAEADHDERVAAAEQNAEENS